MHIQDMVMSDDIRGGAKGAHARLSNLFFYRHETLKNYFFINSESAPGCIMTLVKKKRFNYV